MNRGHDTAAPHPARWSLRYAAAATLVTATAGAVAIGEGLAALTRALRFGMLREAAVFALFLAGAATVLLAHFVFELAHVGYVRRVGRHRARSSFALDEHAGDSPHVTILIPSLREDPAVARRAVLSAVLQTHTAADVVVLVDDEPDDPFGIRVRDVVSTVRSAFDSLVELVTGARRAAISDASRNRTADACVRLADTHHALADALRDMADDDVDHTALQFSREVLAEPVQFLRAEARRLHDEPTLTAREIVQRCDALIDWLKPHISVFQRKRYANLSHSPSKAANLNTYLNLAPGWYVEAEHDGTHTLEPSRVSGTSAFFVSRASYVMNLDADSFVVPTYVTTLVEVLERHERLAIAQSPYRAVPRPSSALERIAGASTDMQYMAHLGLAHFDSAFWVGANAIMRRSALDQIARTLRVGSNRLDSLAFIPERTVIEDSDATVELLQVCWRVYNHHAVLAYSATPSDFGSLIVQRKRWANGGVIIAAGLLRLAARRPRRTVEWTLRTHYLVSTALACTCLPLLMLALTVAFPFRRDDPSPWLAVAALPAVALYARNLRVMGYRSADLLRIYALNLALIPVNLAGTWLSVRQFVTGRRTRFVRTPKRAQRVHVAPSFVVAEWFLLGLLAAGAVVHTTAGRWLYASFFTVNALALSWALVRFLGVRQSAADLRRAVRLRRARVRPVPSLALVGVGTADQSRAPAERSQPTRRVG